MADETKSDATPATGAEDKNDTDTTTKDGKTEKKGKKRRRILRILFTVGLILALLYLVVELLYQQAVNDYLERERQNPPIRLNDTPRDPQRNPQRPQIFDPTKITLPDGKQFDVEWERKVEPPAQEVNFGNPEGILGPPGDRDRREILLPSGQRQPADKK